MKKKTWLASFYFMSFPWVFCLLEFFMAHEALNYAFFMRFSCHIHGPFSYENSPLKSPEKPIKNVNLP